jgi:hypothetical protein
LQHEFRLSGFFLVDAVPALQNQAEACDADTSNALKLN